MNVGWGRCGAWVVGAVSCGRSRGGGRYGSTVDGAISGTWTSGDDVVFVFEVCGVVGVAFVGFKVYGALKFG